MFLSPAVEWSNHVPPHGATAFQQRFDSPRPRKQSELHNPSLIHSSARACGFHLSQAIGRVLRRTFLPASFGVLPCFVIVSSRAFSASTRLFTPLRVMSGIGKNGSGVIMFMVWLAAFRLTSICRPATSRSF